MTKRNLLLDWQPRFIENWNAWKLAFEAEDRVDQRIGLLRIGFDVNTDHSFGEPEYQPGERLTYYLRLADGFLDYTLLTDPVEKAKSHRHYQRFIHTPYTSSGESITAAGLRVLVARTAFDVLVARFFKDRKDIPSWQKTKYPSWAREIFEGDVLEEIVRFFRLWQNPRSSWDRMIVNLPCESEVGKHKAELTRKFLGDLVRFIWKFECFNRYYGLPSGLDQGYRARLDKLKPWAVGVMAYTDCIDLLLSSDFPLDGRCLKVLNGIALKQDLTEFGYVPLTRSEEGRRARTVEESAAFGCRVADVLLLLRNRQRVIARLKKNHDSDNAVFRS